MAICIDDQRCVRVVAPWHISEKTIVNFLREKIQWIERKINEVSALPKHAAVLSYCDGAKFLLLGILQPLCYQPTEKKKVSVQLSSQGFQVFVPLDMPCAHIEPAIASALKRWYKDYAKKIIVQRAQALGAAFDFNPDHVAVRSQKRIWGSCYHRRQKIYINEKIIMAPMEVLDYVLIHELCHLREPNHSKRFWLHVKTHVASYKEHAQWLKDHQHVMRLS